MFSYINEMKKMLSAEDETFLKSIYEPTVVSVPPCDACRNMCVLPDGEIRIYGMTNKKEPDDKGILVYSSSRDCGLSWKTHLMTEGALGSAVRNPDTGRYISCYPNEYRKDLYEIFGKDGTWAMLSDKGPDDTDVRYVKMSDRKIHVLRPPYYFDNCRRWIIAGEYFYPDKTNREVVIFYSDDDGESWTEYTLSPSVPPHETVPPHKGARWQQYSCEPTIARLPEGEFVMFVRTSQDNHWCYRSSDNGATWNGPYKTDFNSTATMPVFQPLSDGRIVFFWCNTRPMPELDHTKHFPPLSEDEINGVWEDFFTNRDVNHLAITEDGMKTWKGFRELFLNQVRNNADFRSVGGTNSRDKSVHQSQMLELPYGKLLVHFGQNIISRKTVIFDINWLYEDQRSEDFRFGLCNVTTHMFVKSNAGGYRGHSGHCAYNRTNGALLVPDPEGNFKEVLQICRIDDPRLVYQKQGVVWNFPASGKGAIEAEIKVVGSGVRFSLLDHWHNAFDEYAQNEACFSFSVENTDGWCTVRVEYDSYKGKAEVVFGKEKIQLESKNTAPFGLSYLHIQTLAQSEDCEGTLLRKMKYKAL